MKENEAPEKIYVHRSKHIKRLCASTAPGNGDIEYTRTDAFIDKACSWLKENAYFYVNDCTGSLNEDALINKFRTYMKEEYKI